MCQVVRTANFPEEKHSYRINKESHKTNVNPTLQTNSKQTKTTRKTSLTPYSKMHSRTLQRKHKTKTNALRFIYQKHMSQDPKNRQRPNLTITHKY